MELGGDEKRIRALFSELSFEDQNATPRFERLWQRSAASRPIPSPGLGALVAVIAVAVIVTAISFAAWSRYKPTQQDALNVPPQTMPTLATPREQETNHVASVSDRVRARRNSRMRLTQRSRNERAVTAEAALLSSWQSPTATLMESPTSSAFNSLPQLNQSVEDLKSFLPKNNEALKESNQ